jgi:hypothetical protein
MAALLCLGAMALAERYDLEVTRVYRSVDGYAAGFPEGAADELADDPGVARVERDGELETMGE